MFFRKKMLGSIGLSIIVATLLLASSPVVAGVPIAHRMTLFHGGLPGGYQWKNADSAAVELPVAAYALLDEYWRGIFFTEESTPNTVSAATIIADDNTNDPGGNVYWSADKSLIVVYAPPPIEARERRLWKYLFGTSFNALTTNGETYFINGYPVYIGD